MKNIERNKKIVEMRKSGMTFAAIGEMVGIGKQRVRDIVLKHERLSKEGEYPIKKLSARAMNGLRYVICDYKPEDITPELVKARIADGTLDLGNIPNMGKVSIQEIMDWIEAPNV
jgi:hypothetical protein